MPDHTFANGTVVSHFAIFAGIVCSMLVLACQPGPEPATYAPIPTRILPTQPPINQCVKIATSYYWVVEDSIPPSALKSKLEEIYSRFLDERGNIVAEHNTQGYANNLYYSTAGVEEALLGYSAAYDPDAWIRPHASQTTPQRWATRWVASECSNR